MKQIIGILHNPDGASPMNICYNGPGEPMTAENADLIEDVGYTPGSEQEARQAADAMWGVWPWEYEEA